MAAADPWADPSDVCEVCGAPALCSVKSKVHPEQPAGRVCGRECAVQLFVGIKSLPPRPILHVMRGLPGSGKTTLAKTLEGVHLSTDAFRYTGGDYVYVGGEQSPFNAVRKCFLLCLDMRCDIVLDAVHALKSHYEDMTKAAVAAEYEVRIHYPQTWWAWNPAECAKRGQHGVPEEVLTRMLDIFEDKPEVDDKWQIERAFLQR